MTLVSALGAIAMAVSTAFACLTADRWQRRRKPHELAWTQSMIMFALASAAYWSAGAIGWTSWNFRVFYLFGAILNVPFLAVGTLYLLGDQLPGGRDLGRRVHGALIPIATFCAGVVAVTPLRAPLPADGMPEGKAVFGVLPRVMAAVGSGLGATVLIAGAAWSAWRLIVRKGPGRLALTNVLIAAGSIVLSLGGTFFTGEEVEVGFGIFLVAGIIVLFTGFLVSTPAAQGPATSAQRPPTSAQRPAEDLAAHALWYLVDEPDLLGTLVPGESGGTVTDHLVLLDGMAGDSDDVGLDRLA